MLLEKDSGNSAISPTEDGGIDRTSRELGIAHPIGGGVPPNSTTRPLSNRQSSREYDGLQG